MKAIRAFDHGDKYADRYTIVFDDGSMYAMSDDANMPNGFCQYIGGNAKIDDLINNRAEEIDIANLPSGTMRQITNLEKWEA